MKDPLKAGIFLFLTWLLFGFSVTAAETPFEPVGDFAHARASYFTTRDGLKLYYQEVWPVQEL